MSDRKTMVDRALALVRTYASNRPNARAVTCSHIVEDGSAWRPEARVSPTGRLGCLCGRSHSAGETVGVPASKLSDALSSAASKSAGFAEAAGRFIDSPAGRIAGGAIFGSGMAAAASQLADRDDEHLSRKAQRRMLISMAFGAASGAAVAARGELARR